MAKKKGKGVFDYAVDLFSMLLGVPKWLVITLWHVLVWFFNRLSSAAKKGAEMRAEAARPKTAAAFAPLQEIESKDGSLEKFESELYSGKSLIGLVLGARGSGKSAIGMRMLENMRAKGMNVYALGFGKESLPQWIHSVDSVEEVKPNSFLLADEGGIEFSSRNSMSEANKLLSSLLFISRHKDLSVLFITQNSANIEINTLRQIDYLVLKSPSLLQLDFERKKIKDIYTEVKGGFEQHKDDAGIAYLYSHNYQGFVSNSLPSFWSSRVSKAYKGKQPA